MTTSSKGMMGDTVGGERKGHAHLASSLGSILWDRDPVRILKPRNNTSMLF